MPIPLPRHLLAGGLLAACLAILSAGCQTWTEKRYSADPLPTPGPVPAADPLVTTGPAPASATGMAEPVQPCPTVRETLGYITVRPRGQLGLKLDGTDTPLLANWGDQVGIPLEHVDCFLVTAFDDQTRRALLVRTTRPINQGTVRVVCGAGTVARNGKRTLYRASSGLTVHFPEQTLALVTDSDSTMKACLKGLDYLTAHLDSGAKHDLTILVRATNAAPAPRTPTCVTSYKLPRFATPPKPEKPKKNLLGLSLPFEVKTMTLNVDVGDAIDLRVALHCADADGVEKAARLATNGLEMARGLMLLAAGQVELLTAFGDKQENQEVANLRQTLPLDLARPAEQGLRKATVRIKGTTAFVHARLPISGQRLGAELTKLSAIPDVKGIMPDGPGLFFSPPCERPMAPRVSGSCGPASAGPSTCAPTQTAPASAYGPPQPAQDYSLPSTSPTLPGTPPAAPLVAPPPMAPPAPAPLTPPKPPALEPQAMVSLTVANCQKDAVLLFRVEDNKDLTFSQKIPPGKAIDVASRSGERWVAVFPEAPYRAQITASPSQPIWLLRPDQVVPPTPIRPSGVPPPATTW